MTISLLWWSREIECEELYFIDNFNVSFGQILSSFCRFHQPGIYLKSTPKNIPSKRFSKRSPKESQIDPQNEPDEQKLIGKFYYIEKLFHGADSASGNGLGASVLSPSFTENLHPIVKKKVLKRVAMFFVP